MIRRIDHLSGSVYDVVVVGGGIHGAFVAWDGAQRGLRVALVEQADFAAATTGNSQRIIHGGLRYLQQLDIGRARESARERRILMEIAPHFIRPLPCLLAMERGREIPPALLSLGLHLYGLLVPDRQRFMSSGPAIPSPRRVSGHECVKLLPELECIDPSSGLLFYDGYARDAERFVLAILESAALAGADLANYVRVVGPLYAGQSSIGIRALDVLSNREFDIRARLVVNCSGPWSAHVSGLLRGRDRPLRLLKAVVLGTKPLVHTLAFGLRAKQPVAVPGSASPRPRYLFFTPGRGQSLLGTWYAPYQHHPDQLTVTESEIEAIVAEVNRSYPAAALEPGDVRRVYAGLLPADARSAGEAGPECARRYRIYSDRGTPGQAVVSIVGVKLSTARAVAARALDDAVRGLGLRSGPCRTHERPLSGGGDASGYDPVSRNRIALEWGVSADVAARMLDVYGGAFEGVLRHVRENPRWGDPISPGSRVIGAQVVHAARFEMAQKLTDVVLRRTDLGVSGTPDSASLQACASILSSELGWTQARTQDEVAEIESARVPCLRC